MNILCILAAVFLTVNASSDMDQWVKFKRTHSKTYKSLLEERTRFGIFQNNLRTIEEHNARYEQGQETYYKAVTRFADMTLEEFKQRFSLRQTNRPSLKASFRTFPENLEVPKSIDWVEKGAVLPVKDQMLCGSCYAFSTTGALEGQNAIVNNVSIPLSEQQIIDCSGEYYNLGCNGGFASNTFNYIQANGIEAESSYPYKGNDLTCRHDPKKSVFQIKGHQIIFPIESESALEKAVATVGPISVGMNSGSLILYGGGIVNDPECELEVDHQVLAVGYGISNGTKYWKLKNSWSSTWGEDGYFRLAKDQGNMCCIACGSSYPIL